MNAGRRDRSVGAVMKLYGFAESKILIVSGKIIINMHIIFIVIQYAINIFAQM
jgi:hypothetical protein